MVVRLVHRGNVGDLELVGFLVFRFFGQPGRHAHGELRANIRRALDADIAAHHFAQLFADRQAEPGTAGGVCVRFRAEPGKRLEQGIDGVGSDTVPLVGHADFNQLPVARGTGVRLAKMLRNLLVRRRAHLDADRHRAALTVFDRIAQQIGHNLLHAAAIRDDGGRQYRLAVLQDLDAFGAGIEQHERESLLQDRGQVGRCVFEVEFVRIDLGHVQNIVDDSQQNLAAGAHGLEMGSLFVVHGRIEQQSGEA